MRALVAVVLLGGCFGVGPTGSGGGGSRPAVMPMLSELPSDPVNRDAVLDQASQTAGPEQRQGMTKKERQAETAAATAAAILGGLFSSTKSVTIGGSSQFDENQLIAPQTLPPLRQAPNSAADPDPAAQPDAPPADDASPPNGDLVPWIKLK